MIRLEHLRGDFVLSYARLSPEMTVQWKHTDIDPDGEQYLDGGVERRSVLPFEAGSDIQHVRLAPRHHDPHQGAVVGPGALNGEVH